MVDSILREHGFQGYRFNLDELSWTYPAREMIVQWQENDLDFIRRILSEVGIWFRIELHPDHPNITVILFGDAQRHYRLDHPVDAVSPSGMSSDGYSLRAMTVKHAVVTGATETLNYNYRESRLFRRLTERAEMSRCDEAARGSEYHYGDIHLHPGDRYAIGKGQQAETSWHYARIRHERSLVGQTQLGGVADDPAITPGTELSVRGDAPAAFAAGFVVTAMTASGSRDSGFQAVLSGMPYSEIACFRPERLPRPSIAGTLPARISGRSLNDQLARVDEAGRYRVRFDFDRAEWQKGRESMWVRLGRPYGGDNYGMHFPLMDNTEVGIAFENGDPERPFIAHVFHDEINPDLVTDRNSTRNLLRTLRKNELRMEDRVGQEHIRLSTEYGKSQLSLGHMVDEQGKPRGQGVELRTDNAAALRSAQGFHITTQAQPGAAGSQNDMAATVAQLESALRLARSLAASAGIAQTPLVDAAPLDALRHAVGKPGTPTLSLHGEGGLSQTTPGNMLLHAEGQLTAGAKQDLSLNAFRRLALAAGETLSVFVRRAGMMLTAAKGAIRLTAQQGAIEATATEDVTVTSSGGRIVLNAKSELLLMCGGAGIRLKDGTVEVLAPSGFRVKSPNVDFMGGEAVKQAMPSFKRGELAQRFRLHAPGDPDHILKNQRFELTRPGESMTGTTDENGCSSLLDSSELDTWTLALRHDDEAQDGQDNQESGENNA